MANLEKKLSTLTMADLDTAKSTQDFSVCPAGKHTAKIMSFTEEDTYNYVSLEIEGKVYNFFYSYYLRDSDDLNKDVLDWIGALATIPTTPTTPLLACANSAIGHSYEIETRVYTSNSGKNAGREQHAINFNIKPTLVTVAVEEEEIDLPF